MALHISNRRKSPEDGKVRVESLGLMISSTRSSSYMRFMTPVKREDFCAERRRRVCEAESVMIWIELRGMCCVDATRGSQVL